MKRFSEQLKKQATTVSLRAAERRELRERVVAYMEYHPLPQAAREKQTTTPARQLTEPFTTIPIPYSLIARWTGAFSVVILFILPVWAERSVPGDTLYPIKVRFNEELRSTLSFTPTQKIEWETTRLSRRIAEARLLASEGLLTEAIEVRVAEAVREHSANVQREIEAIRVVDADEASLAALEVATTLDVHASSFESAETDTVTLMTTTQPVRTIIADAIAAAQAGKTEQYSSSTIPAQEKLLARLEIHTTRLYEMRTSLVKTVSPEDLENIDRRIADIERAIAAAQQLAETDDLAARFAMVDILQRSQRLLVFISTLETETGDMLEVVAPIELTVEEKTAQLETQQAELGRLMAMIAFGVSQVDETDGVLEKVLYAQSLLITEQAAIASSTDAGDIDGALGRVAAALMTATDATELLTEADVLLTPPATTTVPVLDTDASALDAEATSTDMTDASGTAPGEVDATPATSTPAVSTEAGAEDGDAPVEEVSTTTADSM